MPSLLMTPSRWNEHIRIFNTQLYIIETSVKRRKREGRLITHDIIM